MSVDRSISKRLYVVAGIITVLIFLLGILFGIIIDYERVNAVEDLYQTYDLDYRSLQLQFSLLNVLGEESESCSAFEIAMNSAVSELIDSLERIEAYKEVSSSQQQQFEVLQRRYILDNIRYWLVVKEARSKCDIKKLPILYLYSADNCDICPNQGVILTYFKKKYGEDLLVFPINTDLATNEPVINFVLSNYNITKYPSIVVGDKKYEGVVSQERLGPIICSGLSIPINEC